MKTIIAFFLGLSLGLFIQWSTFFPDAWGQVKPPGNILYVKEKALDGTISIQKYEFTTEKEMDEYDVSGIRRQFSLNRELEYNTGLIPD